MREQMLAYEQTIPNDDAMADGIAVVLRRCEARIPDLEMIWGENWKDEHLFLNCSLCLLEVIVRPIFKKALLICPHCMPKVDAVRSRARSGIPPN